jgi:hypothetical protein
MTSETSARHRGPAVLGIILFVVAAAVALSIDVPRTGYGIKSDEATYVAEALSLAFDRDLSFTRHDLERFSGLYHAGPDGIFLKTGKELRIRVRAPFPFVHVTKRTDPDANRLYFGKSMAYAIFAAPFVRFFGLNGLLLAHVVLLAIAGLAAYRFIAAQSAPVSAAAFVSAFFGASVLPVYGVFLMPEIFNFTLVVVAYFLWLYKEVAPGSRWNHRWTDLAAAVLLGVCTYSKPIPTAILVAPLVVLPWLRRRWAHGLVVGATAVAIAAGFFALNAAVSGEFNYQGGERRTFYGRFPFDRPDYVWQTDSQADVVRTDGDAQQDVLTDPEAPRWFLRNLKYFFIGRHFGFVPYFFPGLVAIGVYLLSRQRRDPWRVLVLLAFLGSTVALLAVLPFTWSGGGGPPGNRYLFTAYPVLLFLTPPALSASAGVLAWIGGSLFTAKMLANPFWAAKYTYLVMEKGPARRLPVELTMANDLPVQLAQPLRGNVQYRLDPGVKISFLDQNAWPPEPTGLAPDGSRIHSIWVSGAGRADIVVRSAWPVDHFEVELESPIPTVVTLTAGEDTVTTTMVPGQMQTLNLKTSSVKGWYDYDHLLSVRSTEGFVPHLMDPANNDYRNLSVLMRFKPVLVSEGTASPK